MDILNFDPFADSLGTITLTTDNIIEIPPNEVNKEDEIYLSKAKRAGNPLLIDALNRKIAAAKQGRESRN